MLFCGLSRLLWVLDISNIIYVFNKLRFILTRKNVIAKFFLDSINNMICQLPLAKKEQKTLKIEILHFVKVCLINRIVLKITSSSATYSFRYSWALGSINLMQSNPCELWILTLQTLPNLIQLSKYFLLIFRLWWETVNYMQFLQLIDV